MIASVDEMNQVSEPVTVELDEGHKMRGFYTITNESESKNCNIYIVVELPDSQMSFQRLDWAKKSRKFYFHAFRDVHPRSEECALRQKSDPVKKYS